MTRILLITLIAGVWACATTSSPTDARAAEPDGARLYREHCGACHRLRAPSEQTRDRWAWAVEHYGPRAHLSPGERQLVTAFLQAHASDAGAR